MDELPIGTKIERYVVEARLGDGGMAAVYRVQHTTLGTQHALKVLTLGGKKLRARLVHEGRVQAMLNHPNVVAVRDVLDVDGAPGLLMDFVDGPDLEDWIREQKPDPERAEEIFRQIVKAVRAAHRQGVVHRDLKPANVLMERQADGEWQARVADFGLAKAFSEGGKDTMGLTRTGATMGTPAFMAPEQIRDASTVDHRADVWALGCIFYQLLTWEQAFAGIDIVEVFNQVTRGDYVPAQQIRASVTSVHDEVIARCLRTESEERLRSCDAILDALDGNDEDDSVNKTWEGGVSPVPPPDSPPLAADASEPPLVPPQLTPRPAPQVSPAEQVHRQKPTPLAWAIPLVMAVVLGTGSFALVAGLAWTASSIVEPACTGWVKGPLVFSRGQGDAWVVPRDRDVVRAVPAESNEWTAGEVACVVPAGTTVTLVEDPVRLGRAGIWIRILPDNVVFPEPEPNPEQ